MFVLTTMVRALSKGLVRGLVSTVLKSKFDLKTIMSNFVLISSVNFVPTGDPLPRW
jgi:ABC-type thiamin/hydroxymethylpyrimidine transport system permease subunit